ncbi:alpha/beta hydrolase [Paraburkholderia sp. JHI869]|uniref:alpha/beta hydrolase n=1 Tax=Paraburkholderia sp. JHI869 TaxID=3112959 RepID=UPI00317371D2
MNLTEASPLSEGMRAFIRTAASFQSASDDWPSRRAAFARQCAYFTRPAKRALVVTDQRIGGVMTRCYRPAALAPERGWPVLVFFHGGGWSTGSHTTHDWFAHALIERAGLAVLAIDYRLAPEASFPAPLDDGLAVWHALSGAGLPLDPARRAVAGDSAGGTLAAALCIALRERREAQPLAQALLYPVLSADETFASVAEHAHAPMLTARGLAASIALYAPNERDRHAPLAMPLECDDFSRLAPALIVAAMEDVLRDQGIEYAARLRQAGGHVELYRGHGLVHAALRATELDEVAQCYDRLARFLAQRGVAHSREPQ